MKIIYLISLLLLVSCSKSVQKEKLIELKNPILPGYFADPSLVQHEGKFYMYATVDPWGENFLSCWESADFQHWTFNQLNWPSKEACHSPLSNTNKVWAPSVIKKGNKFYMYVSVGSEIWCGVADHPLGPWKNMLDDTPLVQQDTTGYYHVIDAEAFIDDDGRAYLYWGSGWGWMNGHCFAAELNNNMSSFSTQPVEVTPSRYFEGPFMIKNNGKYYLTYSEGKTIDETYEVRYAIGNSPLGPFKEAANSPILTMNDSLKVYGPGHHTIFCYDNKNYILYHRHRLPFESGSAYRQICMNELRFDAANAQIEGITPDHIQLFPDLKREKRLTITPIKITASSEKSASTKVENLHDRDYSTRWEPSDSDETSWILSKFSPDTQIKSIEIRFEYPWKTYYPKIEYSSDGYSWKKVVDYREAGVTGSPVTIEINQSLSYLRMSYAGNKEAKSSIWEIFFY